MPLRLDLRPRKERSEAPAEAAASPSASGSIIRLREGGSRLLEVIEVVSDDKGCVDEGVEVRRSVYEMKDSRFEFAFKFGEWPEAFEEESVSQVAVRVGDMCSVAVPGDEETEGGVEWLVGCRVGTGCLSFCAGSELETAIAKAGPVAGGRDTAVRWGLVD